MTSSFPRLSAAWLGVRVASRKKVRRPLIAMHESGGLSPFRGHGSALNAGVEFTRAGAFDKRNVRESGLSRPQRRRGERAHPRVPPCRRPARRARTTAGIPGHQRQQVPTVICRPERSHFGPKYRSAHSTDHERPLNPGTSRFSRTLQGTPTRPLGGSHRAMPFQQFGDLFMPASHGPPER